MISLSIPIYTPAVTSWLPQFPVTLVVLPQETTTCVGGNWSTEANIAAHQIPVEHPVGMEVMDPVQNLIQEGLHHPSGQLHGLLVGL